MMFLTIWLLLGTVSAFLLPTALRLHVEVLLLAETKDDLEKYRDKSLLLRAEALMLAIGSRPGILLVFAFGGPVTLYMIAATIIGGWMILRHYKEDTK